MAGSKQAERIRDEISARVMEKYAEQKGLETREDELSATLSALSEITNIPIAEINDIARDVQDEYAITPKTTTIKKALPQNLSSTNSLMAFERLSDRDEYRRRGFLFHLVPYLAVNGMLVYLNIFSTSFPWAMFPILGWGIGLVSHYLAVVRWPARSLKTKIRQVKDQIDHILLENWPGYSTERNQNQFNGVYRLTVTQSSKELIEDYIRSCDSGLSPEDITRISTQLRAVQSEIELYDESNKDDEIIDYRPPRPAGPRGPKRRSHKKWR